MRKEPPAVDPALLTTVILRILMKSTTTIDLTTEAVTPTTDAATDTDPKVMIHRYIHGRWFALNSNGIRFRCQMGKCTSEMAYFEASTALRMDFVHVLVNHIMSGLKNLIPDVKPTYVVAVQV